MLYQELLRDARFFSLLTEIDLDLAEETRLARCPCGGVLHWARYRRKPRGGPFGIGREVAIRQSLCCSVDGCRCRSTPPSVLFLGRKVFFGVVVLLVPILREGLTPARFRRLEEELPVSRRTVQRWRRWWRETVPETTWWRLTRSRLSDSPGMAAALPSALMDAFALLPEAADRTLAVLRLAAPLAASVGRAL